jgi:hypothetical protein
MVNHGGDAFASREVCLTYSSAAPGHPRAHGVELGLEGSLIRLLGLGDRLAFECPMEDPDHAAVSMAGGHVM